MATEISWVPIMDRYKNSVLQILVTEAKYDGLKPYMNPIESKSSGSGFLIDNQRGFVVTNAHVIGNAVTIVGRVPKLGRRDLKLDLISISIDKDLALLKLNKNDLRDLLKGENPKKMVFDFGDNMKLRQTEPILGIGYPLGETGIKYTTGIVAGFRSDDETGFHVNMREDVQTREAAYIQITAPLNSGVSGGPLINTQGQVVGINSAGIDKSQNIGFAIGIRTFLSLYKQMLKEKIIRLPNFNLRWGKLNTDMSHSLTNKDIEGIHVQNIFPDSIFYNKLQKDDVITQISYNDPFLSSKNINLKDFEQGNLKEQNVTVYLDKYGVMHTCVKDLTDNLSENASSCKMSMVDRKLSFPDFVDMLPYGTNLTVTFNRGGEWKRINTKFEHVKSNRLRGVYPQHESIPYVIIAGMCITPMMLNQTYNIPVYQMIEYDDSKLLFENHLIVTQVFPDTEVYNIGSIYQGDILSKVNGIDVKTITDLEKALNKNVKYVSFSTNNGGYFSMEKGKMKKELKELAKYLN